MPSYQWTDSPLPGGLRVLVVDDDPACRWIVSSLLKRMGYVCRVASNGREALALVPTFLPEAIVMDVSMPVLDGLETARILKADGLSRDIPVLGLSSNDVESQLPSALDAGFDDYLSKPVDIDQLVSRLHQHVAHLNPQEQQVTS